MTDLKTAPASIPTFDEDPFSSEILEDPVPFQRRLLEAGPVTYLSRYGVHALARHDIVKAALSNWQDFTSGHGVGLNEPWRTTGLLESDPPRHDAPRDVLAGIMSARVLRSMTDACIEHAETVIDALIDGAASGSTASFDGYEDVASVLPIRFFAEAAGIDGAENLLPYADHVFNAGGPRNELVINGEAGVPALAEWAEHACQREALSPKGFGSDIWAAADHGDIRHDQAALLTRSLVSAGVDTTVYSLSSLLYAFATNPDQWQAVREDPSLGRVAFDEALRWESPVQMLFRKTSAQVEIEGTAIAAGERVLVCFAAANRDPRRWENPDKFDLSRDPSGHLAFGMGIHQCIGQHAARLQAECLTRVLADRVRTIELAGPVVRHHNNTLRGWESIPLTVEAA
jgi:4-methoxybenzoate monooxygenase (O-demethylating)